MIIQCQSCLRKFIAKDSDIPEKGRMVQCGYCSVTWHQMPISAPNITFEKKNIKKTTTKIGEDLSVDKIKASDGKTYKFLGSQWAELLPSGKTGIFARKKIGKELDQLTGRKVKRNTQKRKKKSIESGEIDKFEKKIDPSSSDIDNQKKLPDIYQPEQKLGFMGYIFLIVVIGFSLVGVFKTFESDLLIHFPKTEYIFKFLDQQLKYFSETFKNMVIIVNDLINSY